MKDHRNNPARVRLPLSAWVWPRRDETGLTPAQVHKLREADRWRHAPPWWGHAIVAYLALVLIISIAFLARSIFILLWNGVPLSMGSLVVYVLIGYMLWIGMSNLRRRARALRENAVGIEVHLERGLCPACTYPLRSIPAAPDGCRVCPECGAAWKLPE